MVNIALVWWLGFFGAGSGTSQAIVPAPFTVQSECEAAGQHYNARLSGGYIAAWNCIPQRRSDVENFTGHELDQFTERN